MHPRGIERVDIASKIGKAQSYASLPHHDKTRTHRS